MNPPSPGLRPPSPRLAGRGQGEGCQSSSWSQCIRENERGLPMNRGTSNIEHPTPNIEWQRESSLTSAFGVRCFPSVQWFNARNLSGNSLASSDEGRGKGQGTRWKFDNRFDSFSAVRKQRSRNPAHEKRRTCSLAWGVRASVISHSFRNSPKNLGGVPRGKRLPFENRRPFDLQSAKVRGR